MAWNARADARDAHRDDRPLRVRVPLVVVVALALAGCVAPVGIKRIDPLEAQRQLSADYLTTGELSESARIFLRRIDRDEAWEDDPEAVLAWVHSELTRPIGVYRGEVRAQLMDEVAELAFAHAMESGDRRYFLAASLYAWLYLFPVDGLPRPDPLARGIRRAADIYNRGLTLAFTDPESGDVVLRDARLELPFGELEVDVLESSLHLGNRAFARFTSLADLEVRGIKNRVRLPGLGAPLAAQTSEQPDEPLDEGRVELSFSGLWSPVTALLVFDVTGEAVRSGEYRAHLRVVPYSEGATVEIDGRTIALESEPTAALALQLTETPPWRRELRGLFLGDLAIRNLGMAALEPYQPGRIPVVLVHGTASSPGRWADLVNDLRSDPILRRRFQFWFFTYNTGNPIVYSGWLLRRAIAELVASLDPDGRDPSLRDLVVMGHSQGGLLTRLLVVDSGERFWDAIFDQPPDEIELEPENRALLEGSLLVRPSPYVERVIFLATPHRGSRLANLAPARFLGRLIRTPANVVAAIGDAFSADDEEELQRRLRAGRGAIGNMSPENHFVEILSELPIAKGVHAHSIIGVRDEPIEESGDGVVLYQSAHLEGVDSELVIESSHSSQSNPRVALEVRRILLEHLAEAVSRGVVAPVELPHDER
jgi:pimeloyl-ACP methyl ester carboxylesterase